MSSFSSAFSECLRKSFLLSIYIKTSSVHALAYKMFWQIQKSNLYNMQNFVLYFSCQNLFIYQIDMQFPEKNAY